MAMPKISSHTRSISLPSSSHPHNANIEDQLRRLSSSQAGPSSASSICQNLTCLKDLYEQISDLINLPHNQKILSLEPHRREVEEVLDGSLALLDICNSSVDVLLHMKESILCLQSAFRRGSDNEGAHVYTMSRKKIYKTISKCLANLKKVEKSFILTVHQNDASIVKMLKEAEAITLSTLKSFLSYLMGKKSISQSHGWSIVAKLVKSKRMAAESVNEVKEIDHALQAGIEPKAFLKQLETLDMAFYDLEDALESVSRRLVKFRVSLLNVLNH